MSPVSMALFGMALTTVVLVLLSRSFRSPRASTATAWRERTADASEVICAT
ncbi:hypothetical protein [Haladaptatus sp. W1]|uniref:hypothetical protein n=1 Tax=Haladaptatus sp. W1 TaxID=1897478 RepID=UPI0020C82E78|nr:hypothetical protein [Haladaptatus sp. W1]